MTATETAAPDLLPIFKLFVKQNAAELELQKIIIEIDRFDDEHTIRRDKSDNSPLVKRSTQSPDCSICYASIIIDGIARDEEGRAHTEAVCATETEACLAEDGRL